MTEAITKEQLAAAIIAGRKMITADPSAFDGRLDTEDDEQFGIKCAELIFEQVEALSKQTADSTEAKQREVDGP